MKFYKETNFQETPIGKIPEEWEFVKLKNVLSFKNGERPKISETGSVPVYGANGIMGYTTRPLTENDFTLIIGRVGASGKVHLGKGKIWVSDNAIYSETYDRTRTFLPFLSYLLEFKKLEQFAVKTTHPIITQTFLNNYVIPLPKLEEQQRIVEVLSCVDFAIEKVDEAIARAERLKKGLMQQLLTKGIGHKEFKETPIGKIPKTWEVVKLEEIIEVMSGRYFKFSEFSKEGVRCLKIDNVGFGEIIWETTTFLPNDYTRKYPELVLNDGDIVLALNRPIIDNKVKVGMLKKEDALAILYQRVGKIIIEDTSRVDRDFLFFTLTGEHFKQQLARSLIGTDQPYVRSPMLVKIKIPLPPLSEQQKVAEIISYVDDILRLKRKKKERLVMMKRCLMDFLLTGKVRVSV